MTNNTTLNAVAIDVVGQYGLASKHLINAYRLGTQRIVTQITERYTSMLESPSLPMVNESIRASMLSAHQQLSGFYVGTVNRVTEQADVAVDRIADGAAQGIKRLGGMGERLESMVGTPVVDTMTKINMPAAQLSLQIAGQVVEGTKRLVERVALVEEAVNATVEAAAENAATVVAATSADVKPRGKRSSAAA